MPQDPKTMITPDAFTVAPDLLGLALATPGQRLIAIGIDAVLAAIVSNTGIKVLVIIAAALLAWRAIGGPVERVFFSGRGRSRWILRGATLILALIIVNNVWQKVSKGVEGLDFKRLQADSSGAEQVDVGEDVTDAAENAGLSGTALVQFTTQIVALQLSQPATARTRAQDLGAWVVRNVQAGQSREELIDQLEEDMQPVALAAFRKAVGRDSAPATPAPPANLDSALLRYVDARVRQDSVNAAALHPLAIQAVAADTLHKMTESNGDLRRENQSLANELTQYKKEAEKKGGITRMLAAASDDLGLGFGWFALYFTAFTVIGRGQTPGKRLLGIKVIRLDKKPLGWWLAFERFGGYAASASTGLLGFAQILWDRNRQGLHDKATETVVIKLQDGQPIKLA